MKSYIGITELKVIEVHERFLKNRASMPCAHMKLQKLWSLHSKQFDILWSWWRVHEPTFCFLQVCMPITVTTTIFLVNNGRGSHTKIPPLAIHRSQTLSNIRMECDGGKSHGSVLQSHEVESDNTKRYHQDNQSETPKVDSCAIIQPSIITTLLWHHRRGVLQHSRSQNISGTN